MTYVQRFQDRAIQIDNYMDQAALQVAMNGLQSGSFKWEMFKIMPKTLLSLMKAAKKHTIAKALYFTRDIHFNKEETQKAERGPLGSS